MLLQVFLVADLSLEHARRSADSNAKDSQAFDFLICTFDVRVAAARRCLATQVTPPAALWSACPSSIPTRQGNAMKTAMSSLCIQPQRWLPRPLFLAERPTHVLRRSNPRRRSGLSSECHAHSEQHSEFARTLSSPAFLQSQLDTAGWDVVGLGQAMVDFSAAVSDEFLEGLGVEKGSRR